MQEVVEQNLTAREILTLLTKGEKFITPINDEAKKLINYLNVLRSRDRKVYMDLDLQYKQIAIKKTIQNGSYCIEAIPLKDERKRYTVFSITETEDVNANNTNG